MTGFVSGSGDCIHAEEASPRVPASRALECQAENHQVLELSPGAPLYPSHSLSSLLRVKTTVSSRQEHLGEAWADVDKTAEEAVTVSS